MDFDDLFHDIFKWIIPIVLVVIFVILAGAVAIGYQWGSRNRENPPEKIENKK